MTAANPQTSLRRSLLHVAVLAGLAAVTGAGLLWWRAPDTSLLPVMAEQPVSLPGGASLYVQKYEISVAEWNLCHQAGGCALRVKAPAGQDPAATPATGLSYLDAGEYLTWINRQTRRRFRLPDLAEWEFMAAGVLPEKPDPVFTSPELTWASAYLTGPKLSRALQARGSFTTSAEGIADLDGNVWEWTRDCYNGKSSTPDRCPAFFVGGLHSAAMSYLIRDPARGGCAVGAPPAHLGMRLVSDRPV